MPIGQISQRIEQYPFGESLGRRRYSTHWREPKLLIIYTVDEQGKMDRGFTPVIEGTLKGSDALFGLLGYHLRQLNIGAADKILFIADGARWIWNRVAGLIKALGLSGANVYELVDFYHAVEHLGTIADLKKNWSKSEKRRWVNKHQRMLLKGHADKVIGAIKAICRGRNSKGLSAERKYFVRNQHRMFYQKISDYCLPIGSGAMESGIRRVVNLRMKGACLYWLEKTAEAMLMLRSYYKAGRWNLLTSLSISLSFLTDV